MENVLTSRGHLRFIYSPVSAHAKVILLAVAVRNIHSLCQIKKTNQEQTKGINATAIETIVHLRD